MSFNEQQARSATTIEEAEQNIRLFILEGKNDESQHHVRERSKGFDLYLPWLIEVIEYVQPLPDKGAIGILELQKLYMDAAWSMVMKGVLRPGPKMATGASETHAYGVGYSVIEGQEV